MTVQGIDFVNHVHTTLRKKEKTRKICLCHNIETTGTAVAPPTPLLKMYTNEEDTHPHYCTSCFQKTDPQLFRYVNFQLLGKISVIDISDNSLPLVNNMFL